MTGLDTNVLVRYLTQDDPVQADVATRAIEEREAAGESCFISTVCLCELVWVLDAAYGYTREEIAHAMRHILQTRSFVFEAKEMLWQVLVDYESGRADFADHVIGRVGRAAGCDVTLSFDGGLARDSRFLLIYDKQ
ncbi:MAG: type II toxin-antitoxin system VapC family toxin [Candidatus Latescibacterota bacterium]